MNLQRNVSSFASIVEADCATPEADLVQPSFNNANNNNQYRRFITLTKDKVNEEIKEEEDVDEDEE